LLTATSAVAVCGLVLQAASVENKTASVILKSGFIRLLQ
jgi:hypothetical protein